MKEAAGVCGGRGQAMEKVREYGLMLLREEIREERKGAGEGKCGESYRGLERVFRGVQTS